MPWGEAHSRGAGTTQEVAEAHQALDKWNIPSGSLAVRAIEAAERMQKVIDILDKNRNGLRG